MTQPDPDSLPCADSWEAAASCADHAQHCCPGDDFRTVEGPSMAMMHIRWLDRGLPSWTLARYVDRAKQSGAS